MADAGHTDRRAMDDARRAGRDARDAERDSLRHARDAAREGTRARRGPRPSLSTEQITRAATSLADTEGLAAVSMARVASAVGVSTMALYRYVSSKDELLGLMVDAALADAENPVPPAGAATDSTPAWRLRLEHWSRLQLDLSRRRPWLMQLMTGGPAFGPNQVLFIERGMAALADTPLTWYERTEVIGRLSLHLLSEGRLLAAMELQARAARAGAPRASDDATTHPALLDYGTLLRRMADPEHHPNLTAALAVGAFDALEPASSYDPDFGLRLILDGVAALVARAEARAASGGEARTTSGGDDGPPSAGCA